LRMLSTSVERVRMQTHIRRHELGAVAPLLYTPEQAAEVINTSRTTLFALMRSGDIASVKIGRSRRIPHDALAEYVNRLRMEKGHSSSPTPAA
jgi:excisionase family DNA binding protein